MLAWTELRHFIGFAARVELIFVDLDAISINNQGGHNLLLLQARSRYVKDNLLCRFVKLNVHSVDLDIGIFLTRRVSIRLEHITGHGSQRSGC